MYDCDAQGREHAVSVVVDETERKSRDGSGFLNGLLPNGNEICSELDGEKRSKMGHVTVILLDYDGWSHKFDSFGAQQPDKIISLGDWH